MEIREQDFSFNEAIRERPLIEVVTKDVRTADIFNFMEAVGGEDEILEEEVVSWWKAAVTEEFSRQDVVLLALIAICSLRLLFFMGHVTWKVMRLMIQWYDAFGKEDHEGSGAVISGESLRTQLAVIRFCHLQFLLVVEKLQREMRERKNEDTQQMLASLVVPQCKDKSTVTLAEIMATLRKIQAQDSCFKAREVEEHLADITQDAEGNAEVTQDVENNEVVTQDVEDNEVVDSQFSQAWERLQEIYASFLRIQARLLRRQRRRKRKQQQHERYQEEETGRCPRRLSSSEDPTTEVLHELQELTRELPQGFTADMFTSLGNAIHQKVVLSPPQPKTESSITRTSVVCANYI